MVTCGWRLSGVRISSSAPLFTFRFYCLRDPSQLGTLGTTGYKNGHYELGGSKCAGRPKENATRSCAREERALRKSRERGDGVNTDRRGKNDRVCAVSLVVFALSATPLGCGRSPAQLLGQRHRQSRARRCGSNAQKVGHEGTVFRFSTYANVTLPTWKMRRGSANREEIHESTKRTGRPH